MIRAQPLLVLALMLGCGPGTAQARLGHDTPAVTIPAPSALCRAAIQAAERLNRLPDRLLDAIAVVESGRRDPVSGAVYPWPWTINAEGAGHFYASKPEAVAAAQAFQAQGVKSIDVGCAQVNLLHHPDAFASLDQAFDPVANAAYAGRFLQSLFGQTNAWPLAAAAYHSFTPDLGAEYARKVLAAWGVPQLAVSSQVVTAPPASTEPPSSYNGRVAVMLPSGAGSIQVLPMPQGSSQGLAQALPKTGMTMPPAPGTGLSSRGLDSYRATPVALSLRPGRAS